MPVLGSGWLCGGGWRRSAPQEGRNICPIRFDTTYNLPEPEETNMLPLACTRVFLHGYTARGCRPTSTRVFNFMPPLDRETARLTIRSMCIRTIHLFTRSESW